jgi:hypothetical protein
MCIGWFIMATWQHGNIVYIKQALTSFQLVAVLPRMAANSV